MGGLAGEVKSQPEPCPGRYQVNNYIRLGHVSLHHGCRVVESAFLPSRGRGAGLWWTDPMWGALRSELRQERAGGRGGGRVVAAVVGSGGAGVEGRVGAGGDSWSSSSVMGIPVVMQRQVFQQCFDLKVPRIQFIDRVGYSCQCCRDVYPQMTEILQVPLLDWFLTCPLLCIARCQGRRHLCRGAEAVPWSRRFLGAEETVEIPQLQLVDRGHCR